MNVHFVYVDTNIDIYGCFYICADVIHTDQPLKPIMSPDDDTYISLTSY